MLERTSPRLLVWTLVKDGRSATCHAQPHALGVEIFWDVDQETQRTEVATTALAAQALADDWRDAFNGNGWMP